MSHTPGPWKLSAGRNKHYRDAIAGWDYEATAQRCWIVESETARRNFVADVITSNSPTGEANARLIATAPALLNRVQVLDYARMAAMHALRQGWTDKALEILGCVEDDAQHAARLDNLAAAIRSEG